MAVWLHMAGASVQGRGRRSAQSWKHHKQVCVLGVVRPISLGTGGDGGLCFEFGLVSERDAG